MSSGNSKELNRRDANNRWSVKMFVVNGEEQWWVENGERNIALCMSREDAECIVESHNLHNFGDDRFLAFIRQQEGRVMELLNTPIDALELTVRSSNCLEKGGIKTIGDLTRMAESDLANIRHFGQKSLSEIKYKLNILGLSLNMPYHIALENMVGSVGDIDMLYTELVYKLKEENKELRMRMLWHPVSERPMEDGEYICTNYLGIVEMLLFEMGMWCYFNEDKVVWIPLPKDRYPISWMPIPEPEIFGGSGGIRVSVADNADRRTGPTIVVSTPTGGRKEFVLPKDPGVCKEEAFKVAMEILETPNIPARLFLSTVSWLQSNGYVEVSGLEGFEGAIEQTEVAK